MGRNPPEECPGGPVTEKEWLTLSMLWWPDEEDAGQAAALQADVDAAKAAAEKVGRLGDRGIGQSADLGGGGGPALVFFA